jgi:hypothetical protein
MTAPDGRDRREWWERATRVIPPLLQHVGPGMAQAATTAALAHWGLGLLATEAGIVASGALHAAIHPARMDPAAPDTPLHHAAALVYAAPITDPACTAGFCLWYPVMEPGVAPTVHPDQVDTVIPLWFPTAQAATRYAAAVLGCPLSFTPDPAAAAQALAAWSTFPVTDRAATALLPDTPWLLTPLQPDASGPWLPWRLFTRGEETRAAVLPHDLTRLSRNPEAAFTDPPTLCATPEEALDLLHRLHALSSPDAALTYPPEALAPYFTPTVPPARRPAPAPLPALSATAAAWPVHAPEPPRRADGTLVWHIATLGGRGAVAWTVDDQTRIRLAGSDPDHPWFWPDAAHAFAVFQRHHLFAAYGVPPVAPREFTRFYPHLLSSAPAPTADLAPAADAPGMLPPRVAGY